MTVYIITSIDEEENVNQDIYEYWEIAWYVYSYLVQRYGEKNVSIRKFKEVKMR